METLILRYRVNVDSEFYASADAERADGGREGGCDGQGVRTGVPCQSLLASCPKPTLLDQDDPPGAPGPHLRRLHPPR